MLRLSTVLSIALLLLISGCKARDRGDNGGLISPTGPTPRGDTEPKTDLYMTFTTQPNSKFDLVITSPNNGLGHAIALARALGVNYSDESWSGATLWLHDVTGANRFVQVTGVPFIPPASDRFSFNDVSMNDRGIEFWLEFDPGGPGTARIPVKLDQANLVTNWACEAVPPGPNPQYRIRCPRPR